MKKIVLFIAITYMGMKANAQVANYNFNNSSYADVNGNNPFAAGSNIGFTTDRFGNANGALALNGVSNILGGFIANGTNATIPNLPIGNSARTISIWVSGANSLNSNTFFSYGATSTNAACGLGQFTTTTSSGGVKPTITTKDDLNFHGWGNDLVHSPYKTNPTTWTHFVVTYTDADVASIYINGNLAVSATKLGWNTTNSVFRLGQNPAGTNQLIAYVDDLKIYNRAISAAEVGTLYNSNTIAAVPIVSAISANPTSATATTINYTLNANNFATTSVINYGTSAASLTSHVTGGAASGVANTATTTSLTGLTSGITYYYNIVATNSEGTKTTDTGIFVQLDPSAAIAEYNFDNNYNNINGNTPFVGSGLTFEMDRHGNAAKALHIFGGSTFYGASVTIPNLPLGNAARTVSIWVKQPTMSSDNYIFRYGYLDVNSVYGLSNQSYNLVNFGYYNDLTAAGQAASGANWVHVVTTFDGTIAKIYKNGVQVAFGNKAGWNTILGSFILGRDTELFIDDLKIYNRAISATEVTNLYTYNSILATNNFQANNLKATIYPNPATDILNISMDNELKSAEIYNLLGQKVLTSSNKYITISNLSKGIYTVRIEDVKNGVATQKLIID